MGKNLSIPLSFIAFLHAYHLPCLLVLPSVDVDVLICFCCLSSLFPGIEGSAEYIDPGEADADAGVPAGDAETTDSSSYGSTLQKAFLFGVILAAVAGYVRFTKRRAARDQVGWKKTMA